jgi:hypothetical protein
LDWLIEPIDALGVRHGISGLLSILFLPTMQGEWDMEMADEEEDFSFIPDIEPAASQIQDILSGRRRVDSECFQLTLR